MPFDEHTIDRELYVPGIVSKVRFVCDDNNVPRILLAAISECKEAGVYSWLIAEKTADSNGLISAGHAGFGVDVNVNDIALAARDSVVVAALSNGRVALLRFIDDGTLVDERRLVDVFPNGEQIACLLAMSIRAVNVDGTLREVIVCGSCDGSLALFHLHDNAPRRAAVLSTQLTPVHCLTGVSPAMFLSGHASGQLHFWDACRLLRLAADGGDGGFNVAAPTFSKALVPLGDGLTSLAVLPNTYRMAFGTSSGSIGVADLQRLTQPNYEPVLALISLYPIVEIAFHPLYAHHLYVAAKDGIVYFDVGVHVTNPQPKYNGNSLIGAGGGERSNESWPSLANSKATRLAPFAAPFPSTMHAVSGRLVFGTTGRKIVLIAGDAILSVVSSDASTAAHMGYGLVHGQSRNSSAGLSYDDLLFGAN